MSTSAHIVKKLIDGKYVGIYNHSDGYPEFLGQLLLKFYDSEEKLNKLIALGDLSFAGPVPEDDPKLWEPHFESEYLSDKCRTYRGRGDLDVDARVGELEDFTTEDYTYVFEDGKWTYYKWNEFKGDLIERVCEDICIN